MLIQVRHQIIFCYFISQVFHVGQSNTVYYFDVQNEHFEEALNLFSSFFTCPLFTESSTFREINAVDSENTKNLQSDMWREFQLFKSLAAPGHPFTSFSTGNLDTLKNTPEKVNLNIRDLMIQFYNTHYSANRMKVVCYGNQPLDTLQQWVEAKFQAIPNKNLSEFHVSPEVYPASRTGKLLEVVPIKDTKSIAFYFSWPPVEHKYRSKPDR